MKFKVKVLSIVALLSVSVPVAHHVFAQDAKCEGPAELCAQVQELQKDLAAQKALSTTHKMMAASFEDQSDANKNAELLALAASVAVILKLLISWMKSWAPWLQTDKQKALMKAALLLLGFGVFLAGNIAGGLPWWQALIVAGGAPGAILVHELTDLYDVFLGKKKLPDDLDPTKPSQPPAAPKA